MVANHRYALLLQRAGQRRDRAVVGWPIIATDLAPIKEFVTKYSIVRLILYPHVAIGLFPSAPLPFAV